MSKRITQAEYNDLFKKNPILLKRALNQAYEVRKFEIDLYWKRATYFWTFIGASFVAYAAFYNAGYNSGPVPSVQPANPNKDYILTLISCIGLVFSVAWHCVNKGSKYWQENWENHVELLEDAVFGPLYKTLTKRPDSGKKSLSTMAEKFFVAPKSFSVSKVNQLVSTYIALVWLFILCVSIGPVCPFGWDLDWRKAIPVTLAILTCSGFWLVGRSHEGKHGPYVYLRETAVNEDGM